MLTNKLVIFLCSLTAFLPLAMASYPLLFLAMLVALHFTPVGESVTRSVGHSFELAKLRGLRACSPLPPPLYLQFLIILCVFLLDFSLVCVLHLEFF